MKSEISNLSDSDDVVIRSDFVADAGSVTAALCVELEEQLLAMMMQPGNEGFFRVDFKPICNIQQLQEPHKFLVRLPIPPPPANTTHSDCQVFAPKLQESLGWSEDGACSATCAAVRNIAHACMCGTAASSVSAFDAPIPFGPVAGGRYKT